MHAHLREFNLLIFLKRYFGLIAILSICICVQILGLQSELEYQRTDLFSHPHRLVFCHLSHITWAHLLVNLVALLLVYFMFFQGQQSESLLANLLALALGVSLGLYLFSTEVQWYRGMSGVLHGYFVLGCVKKFATEKIMSSFLLSALIGKLIWEQYYSNNLSSLLGGSAVIVDAHLWGAVTGLILGIILKTAKTLK